MSSSFASTDLLHGLTLSMVGSWHMIQERLLVFGVCENSICTILPKLGFKMIYKPYHFSECKNNEQLQTKIRHAMQKSLLLHFLHLCFQQRCAAESSSASADTAPPSCYPTPSSSSCLSSLCAKKAKQFQFTFGVRITSWEKRVKYWAALRGVSGSHLGHEHLHAGDAATEAEVQSRVVVKKSQAHLIISSQTSLLIRKYYITIQALLHSSIWLARSFVMTLVLFYLKYFFKINIPGMSCLCKAALCKALYK